MFEMHPCEASQKRISQFLQQLERADPALHDLALMGEEDVGKISSQQHLPHGWEVRPMFLAFTLRGA